MAEPTTLRRRLAAHPKHLRALVWGLLALALAVWALRGDPDAATRSAPYSELVLAIDEGRVERVKIGAEEVQAQLRPDAQGRVETLRTPRIPAMDERGLLEAMQAGGVVIEARPDQERGWVTLVLGLLPLLVLPLLLLWMARAAASGRGRPMVFGQSKAKLYDRGPENAVTFDDVAGVEEAEAELAEIVRFLKEPQRYAAVGARVPKGVLLVGAPGTGKTLLARAVAGESGVPFFSLSGSEFVEMFVGVGASRVRDLFEQAKERAPCIIFIDELDAVGKARSGAAGFAVNEEREQTLNQLLVEMDGFDAKSGLVIMAATNRPEILDRALLRAGRFDRQVLVDRPDVKGREAILRVHLRKIRLGPDVDPRVVAQRTPGMVGADLANVVNEAALASVRREGDQVAAQDFEEAIDRLQLGLRKEGRVMTDAEKRRVAVHEAGHALVATTLPGVDPVHRVTILPRSVGALGATLQLPTQERWLMTRQEMLDQICVLLGGRAAEETECRDVSTGAQDDLERATEMARQMVCRFGMSEELGAVSFERPARARAEPQGFGLVDARATSEETLRRIDHAVAGIVGEQRARALDIVGRQRATLDAIASELVARETLQRSDLEAIVGAAKEPLPAVA
jgi:cell division protease FtsH